MRWPWQKREARRTDAPEPSSERSYAPEMVLAPPPSPRAWATLPPLVPAAAPRLATTAEVRPAAALATITNLVHRFEPTARDGEGPSGSLLDAARVISRREAASEAVIDYTPVALPPMPVRRAPVVEIVVPPEPEVEAPALVAAPPAERRHTRDQPVITNVPTVEEAPEPEPEVAEPLAPTPIVRRNLGQSRRLGLGAPIVRPEPEPERVPDDIRSSLQSTYGVDVGDVAIRRDDSAATEARELGAAAFAREGAEVVLPPDLGPTDRPEAKGALAHELTHIAQQRRHGAGLPSEESEAGRALEAEARAAEQHFRGDAGAPAPRRDDPSLLLTTGVADVGVDGELTFAPPPRPASGVQRLTLQATTPPYRWQQDYLQAEYEGPLEPGAPEPSAADVDEAAAQLERDHLDELVQFRQSQRGQYVDDELGSRSVFSTPTPDTEGLSADKVVVAEQKSALEQELRHRTEVVEIQNEAVEEVDAALPLRDTGADADAVRRSVDSEPEVVRLRDDIARLDQTYPDLVHPTATEGGPPVPQFRTRDLIREAFPGFRTLAAGYGLSAPSTGGVTGPTGVMGPSSYSAGLSPSTTRSAAAGFAPAPPAVTWEGGSYARGSGEASAFMDWLDDGEPGLDELADLDGREQELAAWPQIRAERNHLLRLYIAEMVTEIRREAQEQGRPAPSEYQATTLITRSEWQAIAEAVEQQLPLEHLRDEEFQLFGDPENAHLRELVSLSPTSREEEEAAGPAAARAPGTEITPAQSYDTGGYYGPGETEAAGPYGAAEPAAPADEPEGGLMLGGGVGGVVGAAAMAIASLVDRDEEEDAELELSAELLARLTTALYPRFRSRLRTELLVDRERAGLLTDFR